MQQPTDLETITAEEVGNYVVCPEAWRLKYLGKGKKRISDRTEQGKQLRKEWVERQDLSAKLRFYAKIVYALLVVLVIIVFLLENQRTTTANRRQKPTTSETAIDGGGHE